MTHTDEALAKLREWHKAARLKPVHENDCVGHSGCPGCRQWEAMTAAKSDLTRLALEGHLLRLMEELAQDHGGIGDCWDGCYGCGVLTAVEYAILGDKEDYDA